MPLIRSRWIVLISALTLGVAWPGAGRGELGEGGQGAPAALQRAFVHWREGYMLHTLGRFQEAAAAFRNSIDAQPTAEGHTFLGWSLAAQGHLREAIGECKKAIEINPHYGNPYNDIGSYLLQLSRPEEAITWLEQATRAPSYCCYHYAHFNLGRALMMLEQVEPAKRALERALEIRPGYPPAIAALEYLRERGLHGL